MRLMKHLLFALLVLGGYVHAAEPTLVATQSASYSDTLGPGFPEVIPSITWLTGDRMIVIGLTEDTGVTLATPTATGLTFTLLDSAVVASNANAYIWQAVAASGGSGTISLVRSGGGGGSSEAPGATVFQFRGSSGIGTAVELQGSSAKVISVTRTGANSHVIVGMADWNQGGDATVDPSPAGGTQIVAVANTGKADYFQFAWGDQGSTGTTNYGITNHTGTVKMTGYALEVLGTGASPATLTSATPSGTLGTSTTATLGATTDVTSGTIYGVVDPSGSISGITAAQVIAAQDNGGGAVVASCNNTVSGTTPTCAITGLTASTAYGYALAQNSAGGNSNVVTGTFTTAAASGSKVVLKRRRH